MRTNATQSQCSAGRGRLGRIGLAALGAVAVALLATASPARAGDEFERAFKFELGRLAAHEVGRAGHQILWGALPHAAPYYGAPRPYPWVGHRYSYFGYGHDRHRGHYKGHGHRHHRGHGYGHHGRGHGHHDCDH